MKLVINDCSFSYSSQLVLDQINMQISEGEVVSIVGPNGSGKSTLLRCISRVLQPQGGVVYLNSQDVAHLKPRELARLLGYVPQSGAEVFPLTVYEAVLLGRKPYLSWGVGPRDREIVDRILRFMKIEEFALKYINEMSGGEKQRVLIARALAQEPEVLLLDEPTSNLDIKHQLEVLGLLHRFAHEGGMTVIMVLHDLNLASRFSEKLVLISEGKVFASGSPSAVLNPANIRAVYDVEADVDQNGLGIQVLPLRSLSADEEDITSLFGEPPVEERQSRAVR
ncbi:MAG: ABC transporter ATP-binding protein [Fastidiosipilaceae bacterium]